MPWVAVFSLNIHPKLTVLKVYCQWRRTSTHENLKTYIFRVWPLIQCFEEIWFCSILIKKNFTPLVYLQWQKFIILFREVPRRKYWEGVGKLLKFFCSWMLASSSSSSSLVSSSSSSSGVRGLEKQNEKFALKKVFGASHIWHAPDQVWNIKRLRRFQKKAWLRRF